MSKIVLEDFNEGDGYYKVNLAYLSKEQVEEIEALVSKWNPTDEVIKACIGICLTDASEQRFKDFGTNLRDCLAWLEKQGNPVDKIEPKFKPGDWIVFNGLTLQVKEIVKGFYRTISKGGIANSYDWNIDNVARLCTIREIPNLDDND